MRTEPKGVHTNGLVGLLALATALLVGCPTDPVPLPSSGCVPGAQATCGCPGAASSVQVCAANRTFGPCQCGDAGMVDVGFGDVRVSDAEGPDLDAGPSDAGPVDVPATEVGAIDIGSPLDIGGTGTDVLPAGCVATTPGNCCGVACPAAANASPVCGGGACTVSCMAGYASCDGTLANGCEVTLATNDAHCGACGNACTMGQRCMGGSCQCPTGQTLCGGRCVNTQANAANCGACGAPCATGRACVAGACVQCTGSQMPCEGVCADTQSNALHCSGCGRACPSGQSCVSGACQTVCNLGEAARCTSSVTAPACCAGGRRCLNGVSYPRCLAGAGESCTSDLGCIGGTRCSEGRCCRGAAKGSPGKGMG